LLLLFCLLPQDEDLNQQIHVGDPSNGSPLNKYLCTDSSVMQPSEYIEKLREVYLGKIGYEYMHIADREACNWLRDRIWHEKPMSKEKKMSTLDRLAWADMFERFLAVKWAGAKRFGLEGCETLVPGMKALIDEAAEYGVRDVVIGMPHRGRLNVLSNVVRKPTSHIFHEFDVGTESEGTGDVKYHLGTSFNRRTLHGKNIHLSLAANPSHLEVGGRTPFSPFSLSLPLSVCLYVFLSVISVSLATTLLQLSHSGLLTVLWWCLCVFLLRYLCYFVAAPPPPFFLS
jgi:2-oxoglutarate dehydrogenase E1 component